MEAGFFIDSILMHPEVIFVFRIGESGNGYPITAVFFGISIPIKTGSHII